MRNLLASLGLAVMAAAVAGQAVALDPGPQSQRNVPITHRHHHRAPYRNNGVEVHAYSFPVTAPRDIATGHASGKRQHKPILPASGNAASSLFTGRRMYRP